MGEEEVVGHEKWTFIKEDGEETVLLDQDIVVSSKGMEWTKGVSIESNITGIMEYWALGDDNGWEHWKRVDMECPKKRCKGIIEWLRILEDIKFAQFEARGECNVCGKVVITKDRAMLKNGQEALYGV